VCFFRSESDTRFTFGARYTFGAGGPCVGDKLRLADDFLPNILPITPSEKGNEVRGPTDHPESDFKVGENSSPPKLLVAEFLGEQKYAFLNKLYNTYREKKLELFFRFQCERSLLLIFT
jgi:hypothetical protein